MRRIVGFIITFALCLGLNKTFAAEKIDSYIVEIVINEDSSINVKEGISYDFGTDERHGIFRTIPYVKTNQEGKKFQMNIDNIQVYDENAVPYNFTTSKSSGDLTIKIGDADKTITGKHLYIIDYTVMGALTYFDTFDELYWNAIGTEWAATIEESLISIKLPQNVPAAQIATVCYTGVSSSTASNCLVEQDGTTVRIFPLDTLYPFEGLTFAVKFPMGFVTPVEPEPYYLIHPIVLAFIIAIALFWYIFLPLAIFLFWYQEASFINKHKKVATAWFAAPKLDNFISLTPAEVGYLVSKKADTKLFTATLISLAQRGFFKIISETESVLGFDKQKFSFDNSTSKKLVEDIESLAKHELLLYNALFKDRSTVTVDDFSKSSFSTTFTKFNEAIDDRLVKDGLITKNLGKDAVFKVKSAILIFFSVYTLNVFMFIALRFWSKKLGFTEKGIEKLSEALALKNFLVSQNEKLDFQAENQMFFEKLLPYASALGVEDVWIKRFKDLNIKQPDWYQGDNLSTSSLAGMSRSLGSSVSRAHATSTRSSSGFSSGSSGGSSGGGGGGGGGGSW